MSSPPPKWSRPSRYVKVPGLSANALDSLHLNAYLEYAVGNHVEATGFLNRAIEINPKEAAYYFDLGVARWHCGQYFEAQTAFAEAAALDSSFGDAFYNAGLAAARLGHSDHARRYFQDARKADVSLMFRALIDLLRSVAGKTPQPLERYAWRIPTKEFPSVLDAIGFGLMQRGEYERAAAKIRQALALEQTAKRHAALGTVLKAMKNFAEAQREFDTALRLEQSAQTTGDAAKQA